MMSLPPFPLANVQLVEDEPGEAIDRFLKHRTTERWVLLGRRSTERGTVVDGMDSSYSQ